MIEQLGKMGGSLLGLGATVGAGASLGALFAPNDRIEGAFKGAAAGGMLYGGKLINKNATKLMSEAGESLTRGEAISSVIGRNVSRQAMGGAMSGAIVGGLNPMGDDGFFRGAAKGAMYGGALGAVIGSKPVYGKIPKGSMLNANKNGMVSMGGKLSLMKDGKKFSNFTNPTYGGIAGVVGGVFGGAGRRRPKQNTTMQANQWTMGTHPRYFGNY